MRTVSRSGVSPRFGVRKSAAAPAGAHSTISDAPRDALPRGRSMAAGRAPPYHVGGPREDLRVCARPLISATLWFAASALGLTGCVGNPPAQNNGNRNANSPSGRSAAAATTQPGRASDERRQFPLDRLSTSTLLIGTHSFRIWLAQTDAEKTEGLMFVPESEIADDQGMLFVFDDEQVRSFWMRNTITPLDIAYARFDGTIVKIHTMPPLTLRSFSSLEPAMFALEVKAGTFDRLNIREGDRMVVPDDVFKRNP